MKRQPHYKLCCPSDNIPREYWETNDGMVMQGAFGRELEVRAEKRREGSTAGRARLLLAEHNSYTDTRNVAHTYRKYDLGPIHVTEALHRNLVSLRTEVLFTLRLRRLSARNEEMVQQ